MTREKPTSKRRDHQRGTALILALVVLVTLLLIGAMVMRGVEHDTTGAGRMNQGQSAMHIAEAGIAYGLEQLRGSPFDLAGLSPNYNTAIDGSVTAAINDADCNTVSCKLFGWQELTCATFGPANGCGPQSFGGGTYRVGVQDDVDDEGDATQPTDLANDTNQRILIRSLGISANGARRMIEVAVSVEGP
jgi:Tfp pilus assembly protein PilX